jgi:hypothetical protein
MYNRDMWKKHKVLLITAGLAAILIISFAFMKSQENAKMQSIDSFEECAAAGYPIMDSYPQQCMTPDKRTFTNPAQQEAPGS